MLKKIIIEISLMNQKPDIKVVTNEFKKDLMGICELHFGKNWNNIGYEVE